MRECTLQLSSRDIVVAEPAGELHIFEGLEYVARSLERDLHMSVQCDAVDDACCDDNRACKRAPL